LTRYCFNCFEDPWLLPGKEHANPRRSTARSTSFVPVRIGNGSSFSA